MSYLSSNELGVGEGVRVGGGGGGLGYLPQDHNVVPQWEGGGGVGGGGDGLTDLLHSPLCGPPMKGVGVMEGVEGIAYLQQSL